MGDETIIVPCPTVGRVVYYKTRGSADGVFPKVDTAAIVTAVDNEAGLIISLAILYPSGINFVRNVSNGQEGGMWDWMSFQKDQQKRYAEDKAKGSKPTPDPEDKEKTDEDVEEEIDKQQEVANEEARALEEEKNEDVSEEALAEGEKIPADEKEKIAAEAEDVPAAG